MIADEVDASTPEELEAYVLGALKDGSRSKTHNTHRIGQADRGWLEVIQRILERLGNRSWIYREGRDRNFWVVESSASFMDLAFDAEPLVASREGLAYARGYFDAEGGIPHSLAARRYIQLVQKDRESLAALRSILTGGGISCGSLHNPSRRVDPDYWRFYVLASSHQRFVEDVWSWHPRKRELLNGWLGTQLQTATPPARNLTQLRHTAGTARAL